VSSGNSLNILQVARVRLRTVSSIHFYCAEIKDSLSTLCHFSQK